MSLELLHDIVPGRWRVRVPELRGVPALEQVVVQGWGRIRGVRSVRASARTGSVLISFDITRSRASLLQDLERSLSELLGSAAPAPFAPGLTDTLPLEEATLRHVVEALARVAAHLFASHVPGSAPASASAPGTIPSLADTNAAIDDALVARWHVLEAPEVLATLASSASGLSAEDVARRQREQGPNALPVPPTRSKLEILWGQFQSVPVAMLGASAVLSIATGGAADAVAILLVVAVNASIGYATESKAEHIISSLGGGLQPDVEVMRAGVRRFVPPESIVAGDILLLGAGTFVAADARLLESDGLVIDESALTGESVPVHKRAGLLEGARAPLADRFNMVFRGTLVTGGSGAAVVVAIGLSTQIGQVQSLVGSVVQRETPLQTQLRHLGLQVAIFAGAVCGGVFGVGLLRGLPVLRMLNTSVSLAVAAIPEGLPTVAITTLALGIRRMSERGVLVRELNAVETLGAVQVMCLDKTGTITVNRMTAVAVFAGLRDLELEGRPAPDVAVTDLNELLHVAVLCSEVELHQKDGVVQLSSGSPTESALVQLALDRGLDASGLRASCELLATQFRSEGRSYMATLHRPTAALPRTSWEVASEGLATPSGELRVSVKGRSPEVLGMCRYFLRDGRIQELTESERLSIETASERMAGRALRVLGFACARWSTERAGLEGFTLEGTRDLVWLGLVGMSDPPRDGMKEILRRFHAAGVRTVMITGDQAATAYAIGKAVGLSADNQLETLDSTQIDGIAPDVLRGLVQRVHIFSRVSPANKLQIVRALQSAGQTVAMTGDGINDSPALRAADVGVAMGRSGTHAARDVADVILGDDDLSTMIAGIEQGRTIYDDIKKAVHFILSTNLSEILITVLGIVAGTGETLTPMQLLWINLLSDIFPELALAMQPPEADVLQRPPRDPARPMFDAAALSRLAVEASVLSSGPVAAYLYGRGRYGAAPQSGTLAFTVLAVTQLLHVLSARSETHSIFDRAPLASNRYVPMAVGGGVALQVLATFVPGLRRVLGVVPLGLVDWGVVSVAAVGPLIANESIKVALRGAAVGQRR
jgi:Ca2+-transporting ATPase